MRTFGQQAAYVVTHPGAFAVGVLRAFRANQGLLLAGAVAYYTLLSIVPLLILLLIALSQIIDQGELLATLGRYLEWLIPGQSGAVIGELASFLDHRGVIGWVLLGTMVFFSSLAFTVLENAMSVIFLHRVVIRRRRFLVSAVIPYCYIRHPCGRDATPGDRDVTTMARVISREQRTRRIETPVPGDIERARGSQPRPFRQGLFRRDECRYLKRTRERALMAITTDDNRRRGRSRGRLVPDCTHTGHGPSGRRTKGGCRPIAS